MGGEGEEGPPVTLNGTRGKKEAESFDSASLYFRFLWATPYRDL